MQQNSKTTGPTLPEPSTETIVSTTFLECQLESMQSNLQALNLLRERLVTLTVRLDSEVFSSDKCNSEDLTPGWKGQGSLHTLQVQTSEFYQLNKSIDYILSKLENYI